MKKKFNFLLILGIILLLISSITSIFFGAKNIDVNEVINIIFTNQDNINNVLIKDVRIPRILSAMMVGCSLAICGTMLQAIFRNNLADVSILGISQGATLGVVLSTLINLFGVHNKIVFSLLGSTVVGLILIGLIIKMRNKSFNDVIILASSLSMLLVSIASILALVTNKSYELSFWLAGGFNNVGYQQVVMLLITMLLIIPLLVSSKNLNIISFGDEVATSLGLFTTRFKINMILLIIPIIAISVSCVGTIAFIGLLVPHILRLIIGNDYRYLLPLSGLYGAILLVITDILARSVIAPYEVPISIFIIVISVILLFYLIRKD